MDALAPAATSLELPDVVLVLAVLLAVASLLAVATRGGHVPLTLLLVIVGFACGEIARGADVELPIEGREFEEVLVFVFLPVLVFEAALALSARVFMRNLVPILFLAIGALGVSAALVGLAVNAGLGVPIATALVFGALISATDPVAVTAVFRELGVPQRLLTIVEGESLLNDGIAIVLFNILLGIALGTSSPDVAGGVAEFVGVFLGGAAIGAVLALAVAEIAARLGRLPSTALTIALAYGSFVVADHVLGVSGVMASVAAGLGLSGLSNTLIPREEVQAWHTVWEAAAFTANGILFVLIGLALEADLIAEYWPSILLAVGAVIVGRVIAIVPLMPVLTRLARIPAVGLRNEAVLVWGGLRGGVALALALALPEELAERDRLVAMTGGVVLATLVINATTIRALVRRLGLDEPDAATRFIGAVARHAGAQRARELLAGSDSASEVEERLRAVEREAEEDLAALQLGEREAHEALLSRGLSVQWRAIQEAVDAGLLPQWHGRVILSTLDDQIDELSLGRYVERPAFEATGLRWLIYRMAQRIHGFRQTPENAVDLAYRDAAARRIAAQRALDAIESTVRCAGVAAGAVASTRAVFEHARRDSERSVAYLEEKYPELTERVRHAHAADVARASARREVDLLVRTGLIPAAAVHEVSEG